MSVSEITYHLIRSKRRRTLSLELSDKKGLIVRAPMRVSQTEIDRFVNEHRDWIVRNIDKLNRHREELAKKAPDSLPRLSMQEIRELAEKGSHIIPQRVRFYADRIGVTYGRITIRNQRSRWGSCSSKGNLNFNCLLMLTPPEVLDSVIVHELCHRKHMNHSQAFYDEIYRVFPDYDRWDKWLKKHGEEIMRRMTGE